MSCMVNGRCLNTRLVRGYSLLFQNQLVAWVAPQRGQRYQSLHGPGYEFISRGPLRYSSSHSLLSCFAEVGCLFPQLSTAGEGKTLKY